jgi:hypothetical protein
VHSIIKHRHAKNATNPRLVLGIIATKQHSEAINYVLVDAAK